MYSSYFDYTHTRAIALSHHPLRTIAIGMSSAVMYTAGECTSVNAAKAVYPSRMIRLISSRLLSCSSAHRRRRHVHDLPLEARPLLAVLLPHLRDHDGGEVDACDVDRFMS